MADKKISVKDIKNLREKTSAGMGLCKEALEKSGGDFDKAVAYINKRSDIVNRLCNQTGCKIGLAKIALEDAGKDFEKACVIIKERGWNNENASEADCATGVEGVIDAYVHGVDRKTVSLVEVTCKTDFVARNEDFRKFVHELALQVAGMKPEYVSKEDVPAKDLKEAKKIFKKEVESEGKPEKIQKKIIEGKLQKFYSEKCLLEQKWFKDESKMIQDLLDKATLQFGEPLAITRIALWELGK